ncbi:MAG TPA: hypothetical protein PK370_03075 [Candidatus Woesebacteria bacterium]|nr:hypothetical protein [Candidatus Woesebacteria bacterium]HPJ17117.1 hypothetical protein [Candidatus Woesebacteria bacterium]
MPTVKIEIPEHISAVKTNLFSKNRVNIVCPRQTLVMENASFAKLITSRFQGIEYTCPDCNTEIFIPRKNIHML